VFVSPKEGREPGNNNGKAGSAHDATAHNSYFSQHFCSVGIDAEPVGIDGDQARHDQTHQRDRASSDQRSGGQAQASRAARESSNA
jgi:hypothetical protein